MNGRISGAAFGALALVAPLVAHAQAAPTYYVPPKLIKQGTSSSPIAGKGIVVVQVLVNKDGSFKVNKILRSTNQGDNAAALEIARNATYRPASHGAQKLKAYYDYTLRFTSGGTASAAKASGSGTGSAAAGAGRFEAMLHAGNYSAAQAGLRSYVTQHPNDARAQTDLGVADTFLNDYAGAVTAFDKAGTIPPGLRSVAANAYANDATALLKNNQNDAALDVAKRGTAVAPNFVTYNNLGNAELQAGQNDAAVAALEKARSLAAGTANVKPKDRAQVDVNLIAAYLAAKDVQKANAIAAEVSRLDPSQSGAATLMANYFVAQAQTLSKAGKNADAAALLEQGAAAAPKAAAQLYAQAAFNYLSAQPKPDNDKAKVDADKALAIAPEDAQANFAEGIALANTGKTKDALTYLNKADAAAKKDNNTQLATQIENNIKQLSSSK
ncbi:MAG: hypothetical protein GIX03_11765 [Candidatus Eremiobacteraeota bacterium]|nr:hypothetical protein [Candidatus Eremiobacteraeota bacterium]MBC5803643.1 hypothetical protein [Candidatus Eremiobacteraeota bacterium]MBC5823776.1 hypothetical protein [Candidatus Eremiobacteraeota bacterium]